MKRYTGILGGGDAEVNGIYTKNGIELITVIKNDWSDTAIESLIVQSQERMAKAKAVWQKAHPGLVW